MRSDLLINVASTHHRTGTALSRSLPHTLQNTSCSCHSGDRGRRERIARDEPRCGRETGRGGSRGQASDGLLGKGPRDSGDAASGGHFLRFR